MLRTYSAGKWVAGTSEAPHGGGLVRHWLRTYFYFNLL